MGGSRPRLDRLSLHLAGRLLCSEIPQLQRGSHPDGRESASPLMGGNTLSAALLLYNHSAPGCRGGLTREGGSQLCLESWLEIVALLVFLHDVC